MAARVIQVDSRQQEGKHSRKHSELQALGYTLIHSKLAHGDYAFPPSCAIDTKKDIAELHADVTAQHERFRAECIGARDAGTKLIVLTENEHGIESLDDLAAWTEPRGAFAKRKHAVKPIDGAALSRACATMAARYGVEFHFCAPGETAARIADLLERDGHGREDG